MDGRCGTCKHWQNDWEDSWHIPDDEMPRWGRCTLIDLPGYGEKATIPAFTQDGSEYQAVLSCRADFGCVLWASGKGDE